jgi:hypothetical protein
LGLDAFKEGDGFFFLLFLDDLSRGLLLFLEEAAESFCFADIPQAGMADPETQQGNLIPCVQGMSPLKKFKNLGEFSLISLQ